MSLNSFALLDIDEANPVHSKRNPSSINLEILEDRFHENEFEGIVGHSAALREVLQLVETVAKGNSTVLLLGETGTGKELVARAIHNRSRRRDRGFVKLNCAAIPGGLLESELFGHERGAFTGAIAQKIGRLELADNGSLFLDEIGDIPLDLQPKLLRVLQEREFERLGSTRTMKVDVRVVAATHRDLEGMIANGQFRSDLYYRLNVFPIVIPPLRERPEDIPLLVQHFVEAAAQKMDKTIETIPIENDGRAGGIPMARQHTRTGERDRTRRNSVHGFCVACALSRSSIPSYARSRRREATNSRRRRARTHPHDPERDEVGSFRAKRRSIAPWDEPINALFPDEEAWNRPSLVVGHLESRSVFLSG